VPPLRQACTPNTTTTSGSSMLRCPCTAAPQPACSPHMLAHPFDNAGQQVSCLLVLGKQAVASFCSPHTVRSGCSMPQVSEQGPRRNRVLTRLLGSPAVGECMLVYSRWRPGMPAAPLTHSPSAIRLDDHEGDDLLNFVTFLPEQKLWVHSELAKKRTADDTFVQRRCVRAHAIAL